MTTLNIVRNQAFEGNSSSSCFYLSLLHYENLEEHCIMHLTRTVTIKVYRVSEQKLAICIHQLWQRFIDMEDQCWWFCHQIVTDWRIYWHQIMHCCTKISEYALQCETWTVESSTGCQYRLKNQTESASTATPSWFRCQL